MSNELGSSSVELEVSFKEAEVKVKLAEAGLKESEAALKESEASLKSAEAQRIISNIKLDTIRCLSALLLDVKQGILFDTSIPGTETLVFEEEDQRNTIREKILSLVKKL